MLEREPFKKLTKKENLLHSNIMVLAGMDTLRDKMF